MPEDRWLFCNDDRLVDVCDAGYLPKKMHFTEIVVSKEGYSRLEACLFFAR
jgi:hypothetical protein